jgi:hypothetical protein
VKEPLVAGPTRARRALAGILPVVLALGLTACSGTHTAKPDTGPAPQKVLRGTTLHPGTEIALAAIRAMRSREPVRVHGYVVGRHDLIEVDLRRDRRQRCQGSVSSKKQNATVALIASTVYIHGNTAYWKTGEDAPDWFVRQVHDRWVHFPASFLPDTARLCDFNRLLTWKPKKAFRTWVTAAYASSYAGVPAIELEYHSLKLIVDAKSPHRVLGLHGGEIANDIRFTYDWVSPIKVPAGAIDVRQLRPY